MVLVVLMVLVVMVMTRIALYGGWKAKHPLKDGLGARHVKRVCHHRKPPPAGSRGWRLKRK
jgi:hypothetical protein